MKSRAFSLVEKNEGIALGFKDRVSVVYEVDS